MRSVAAELRYKGIRVNAVMPGAVVSAMTADLVLGDATAIDQAEALLAKDAARRRPGQPADIAAAVCFLASDDAEFITGQTMIVDGGLTAIGGNSPFTRGQFAEPGAMLEAGRRA
jgi:NAD(P)-dependent dehydrogenase (short-subunit alcohol dehydrogenase family)